MTVPPTDGIAEVETDDDLLSDLDMSLASDVESNAEIMAALDPSDDDAPDHPLPVTPVADWMTDVQELARKHGPFAPWQIVQIIRALNAPADVASR
jgi:hypothetical protein